MRSQRFVALKATLVVLVALVLQQGLISHLRVAGAIGNLMLVVTVAAAVTGGADRGVVYGFAAGLAHDLMLDSPFGLSALVLALVGWSVGVLSSALVRPPRWWAPVLAVAAGLASAAMTTVVGHVMGVPYPADDIVRIGLVEGLIAAVLVVPTRRVIRWVHGVEEHVPYRMALR
ncbi:MAG TPA: rod shape-determining protein MreD [Acidimicrobiales bacterium]